MCRLRGAQTFSKVTFVSPSMQTDITCTDTEGKWSGDWRFSGSTSLHAACFFGHGAVATALRAAGAVINEVDSEGRTPLFCAAGTGRVDIVRMLIREGADAAARDEARRHATATPAPYRPPRKDQPFPPSHLWSACGGRTTRSDRQR